MPNYCNIGFSITAKNETSVLAEVIDKDGISHSFGMLLNEAKNGWNVIGSNGDCGPGNAQYSSATTGW